MPSWRVARPSPCSFLPEKDWKPEKPGEVKLTLTIPKTASERYPENNSQEAPLSIRKEQLRVLVIESFPRWEYRYLRNALSRDPGVAKNGHVAMK